MDFYFLFGYRKCGLNEIQIRVKYTLKKRPINLTTDIVALSIDLIDKKDIKNHWNLRVLVQKTFFKSIIYFITGKFH